MGKPPIALHGSMVPVDGPDLTPTDTEALMQSITATPIFRQPRKKVGPILASITWTSLAFALVYFEAETTGWCYVRYPMNFST